VQQLRSLPERRQQQRRSDGQRAHYSLNTHTQTTINFHGEGNDSYTGILTDDSVEVVTLNS